MKASSVALVAPVTTHEKAESDSAASAAAATPRCRRAQQHLQTCVSAASIFGLRKRRLLHVQLRTHLVIVRALPENMKSVGIDGIAFSKFS